jgi:hypothetical protein
MLAHKTNDLTGLIHGDAVGNLTDVSHWITADDEHIGLLVRLERTDQIRDTRRPPLRYA